MVTCSGTQDQPFQVAMNTCPHCGHCWSLVRRSAVQVPLNRCPQAGQASAERSVILDARGAAASADDLPGLVLSDAGWLPGRRSLILAPSAGQFLDTDIWVCFGAPGQQRLPVAVLGGRKPGPVG